MKSAFGDRRWGAWWPTSLDLQQGSWAASRQGFVTLGGREDSVDEEATVDATLDLDDTSTPAILATTAPQKITTRRIRFLEQRCLRVQVCTFDRPTVNVPKTKIDDDWRGRVCESSPTAIPIRSNSGIRPQAPCAR